MPGFEQPGFDDAAFAVGQGGFGSGGGCFLNQTARHTDWSTNSDILLRKRIVLPAAATRLVVRGAIDNDIQIWVNGQDISQGVVTTEGCAELNEFRIIAPDSVLRVGENIVAVRARDRGAESYVDVTVALEVPETWVPGTTQVDNAYSYQLAALDPDGGPLTFSLTQATTGMTIDPVTGVVTWAPSGGLAGHSFPVTVRADDGRGGSDEQKFTVTVKKKLADSPRVRPGGRVGEGHVFRPPRF